MVRVAEYERGPYVSQLQVRAVWPVGGEAAAVEAAARCHHVRVGRGGADGQPGAHAVTGGPDGAGSDAVEPGEWGHPRIDVRQRLSGVRRPTRGKAALPAASLPSWAVMPTAGASSAIDPSR